MRVNPWIGLSLLMWGAAEAHAALGSDDMAQLPQELAAFVAADTQPIYFVQADLDGDKRLDALLVLEAPSANPEEDGLERRLLIVRRSADGQLHLAKRNDRLVLCSRCGGVMGDPFQGIEVGSKSFTVLHYGGSSWRWALEYRFGYSRKDDTWQLVQVKDVQFHASEPDKAQERLYKPPKDFGKIDIADFDPDHWKGQGPK